MSQHYTPPLRWTGTTPIIPALNTSVATAALQPTAPAELGRVALPVRLGRLLVAEGLLSAEDLRAARRASVRGDTDLLGYLRGHDLVAEAEILRAIARILGTEVADLAGHLPDPRLLDRWGVARALATRVLPWKRTGGRIVVVTDDPARMSEARAGLEAVFGPVAMAVASPSEIDLAVERLRRGQLAQNAVRRVAPMESCRDWAAGPLSRRLSAAAGALVVALLLAPVAVSAMLAVWAILTLTAVTGLRVAAAIAQGRAEGVLRGPTDDVPAVPEVRPTVSILVPLFREQRIAQHLVRRLEMLDYPRELLDVILVLEEDDRVTKATLSEVDLPPWMRVRAVPRGVIQTKPRALNYALDFARGSIVGIYDAEDAPAPDQIDRIVARFDAAPPEVVCLQGVLDFYNARQNWLSRCFTIDYASWFRLILPGLARMGLVVPLGGTTVFFRRAALEKLGAWDAHNVTEDADLGLRLARRGWRTELITTVTEEEANCHAWAWVKQRSRWLKGYAMTYAVHMRRPGQLWRDLGPWRFFGVQVLFLGTLSQFALAPLLWTFWLLPVGVPHPVVDVAPPLVLWTVVALFFAAEIANIAIGCVAVARSGRRWLVPWVPTLTVYFTLGALAAWKGLQEMVVRPFYWDKTSHGAGLPPGAARLRSMAPSPARVVRVMRQSRLERVRDVAS